MHQIIATLFSLLVALCHHTSLTARPVQAAEINPAFQVTATGESSMILPDRYQLARYGSTEGGYAEAACVSCRRTDGSSSDH